MAKTVYNAIVNTGNQNIGNQGYITYHKINSWKNFIAFIERKYPDWVFINVYNHATKGYLDTVKKSDPFLSPTF